MNVTNIRLILAREIRDQLRDRRTLFMIFVLPIVLYPLLGMTLSQMMQFRHERPTTVRVIGARNLAGPPSLFRNAGFDPDLFTDAEEEANLLELHFASDEPRGNAASPPEVRDEAVRGVRSGQYDAALFFPDDFARRLDAFRRALREEARSKGQGQGRPGNGDGNGGARAALQVPSPEIIYTTANERSQLAFARLSTVLRHWTEELGKDNLVVSGIPASAVRPFDLESDDVAAQTPYRGAAIWSKVLPVMLLIWAMTGAFYPAVDLCAGEKERGTLETLLSSPAERSEIVLGKLLTIMAFSMATAILNLLSIGVTSWLVFRQVATFGAPPPLALLWLAVALVPVSALFSALCLALAAFARSTKEGQYYLMPLLLVTLPLAILPLAPGVELNLGNSLIPVTGMVLLLRSMLEGASWQALRFLPLVAAVTLTACWLAVRWAVDQFNSETVLFRESERWDVGVWVRHLRRDRLPTPTVAAAVCCGVLILMVRFCMEASRPQVAGFAGFARLTVITQLAVIATPALLMTVMLTSSPRQTLLLRWPAWRTFPAVLVLAVGLHPLIMALRTVVERLYPMPSAMKGALTGAGDLFANAPWWQVVLLLGLVPAVCEEIAFRGFILSGFRHLGHKWRAIVYSALFFGLVHGVLQQSLIACLLGVVIAYVAVQSGSILPGMLFHLTHNSLALAALWVTPRLLERWPGLDTVIAPASANQFMYSWQLVAFGALLALVILAWFACLPHLHSPEESLQEAIRRDEGGLQNAEC
jgi:sodium transport system permease protein